VQCKIDRFGSKLVCTTVEDIYEGKPTSQLFVLMVLKTKWKANSDPPF
jgi:hypothetical protein